MALLSLLLIKISAIMIPQKDHIKYIKIQYGERWCIGKFLHGTYGEVIISKGCAKL